MFRKLALFCFCLIGHASLTRAQQDDINFTAITTKDGLSSNTVNTILKDRYGQVWFGTEDGLDKFDGLNLSIYRHIPGNKESLPANEVLALHEDQAGNIWVGTSGGSLSRYDRQYNRFVNYPSAEQGISNSVIRGISSDNAGRIWVVHYDGVDILDPKTKKVEKLVLSPDGQGTTIFKDSRQRIWIGTSAGLFRFQPGTKSLTRFVYTGNSSTGLAGNQVNAITEDSSGNIWIGTSTGLSMQRPGSAVFTNYRLDSNLTNGYNGNSINAIAVDGDKLWIGNSTGLDIFQPRTGSITRLRQNVRDIHSLNTSSVRYITIDKQGIYWLGTTGGGVNKYDKNLNLFNLVRSNQFDPLGLNTSVVTAFADGAGGQVYVGTQGGGLSLYDPVNKIFRRVPLVSGRKNGSRYITILTLKKNRRGQLLAGTYAEGLFVLDASGALYRQLLQGNQPEDLNGNEIYSILEDRNGNLWVGTNGNGINILDRDFKVIRRFTPTPRAPNDFLLPFNGYIRDLAEDRNGDIWIATHGGGIAQYNPGSGQFKIFNTENSKLPNNKVQSLLMGSDGNLWAGTFGSGLALFNRATGQFSVFSEKEGLPNSTIYKIVRAPEGTIWVSTNKGISSIDPIKKVVHNYNYHNGLQNNNFIRGAGFLSANGTLFFGGLEGFNYFNPKYLKRNANVPQVLITDLKIANQSVTPGPDGPLRENILVAKEINLDFKQNFTLSFVALNYTSPEQNQYAYKLEGFDRDWIDAGHATSVSYTNLDPGEYRFRVRASNNDGIWNEKGTAITIIVHPPFWRSNYAYAFYLLAAIALVYYLRHRSMQKLKRKYLLEQERFHTEQERKQAMHLHELDQLKIKFLTNLSHEFRTPISLILGPVDSLLQQEKNPQTNGQLRMVRRNAKRLLNLVNQLLDFRKMEEKELNLQLSEGELVSFIRDVADSFRDLAERKRIDFVFRSGLDHFYTRFDQDKIERILFNVLSNAFKFTLERGSIALILEPGGTTEAGTASWVNIKISDSGVGISADKKDQVFDRFFQDTSAAAILNQGTGIGLAITREFVRLHGGSIAVDSELSKGTTFTIRLPFIPLETPAATVPQDADAALEEDSPELAPMPAEELVAAANGTTLLPTVLLVEDNEDFRAYLKENLQQHYKVFEATDGKEGWQKALALHPQLVVSDISMPYMDGIQLSQKIKSDKRTSHIPIILLTALTGEEDQIKGLQTGANDYITKPFNYGVLHAKINNLLVLNDTLKHTYSKQLKVATPDIELESDDERLLKDIMAYLEENLTNPQLSVEELSRNIGMSRSSLYNKLLEITGQTPVEFIRSVKLEKAAVLLEKSDMTIAQIAYSVGFSTPNYFAKTFKTKYNMLPSEYITQRRKTN
ncbi:Signal transduction histidine kinase [Cnuella takakiae]|uniref:histidine kinase n=1 Tax=Cnuella takakiae TaxID=1302690 RepID=A0A1M4SBS9_9BACT|nr:hybrid sensor histidine kinase/response regulator transcription factor [Cnuella takakiae]OLY94455.1 hypothetical protein BUE76_23175 [Cnuella takakiae]SHE29632.1 Signal transduction histidine kinase [Cnuella takakiae]